MSALEKRGMYEVALKYIEFVDMPILEKCIYHTLESREWLYIYSPEGWIHYAVTVCTGDSEYIWIREYNNKGTVIYEEYIESPCLQFVHIESISNSTPTEGKARDFGSCVSGSRVRGGGTPRQLAGGARPRPTTYRSPKIIGCRVGKSIVLPFTHFVTRYKHPSKP